MPLLPGIGFLELVVLAAIALVVVGPQDLPKMMRSAGKLAAQARRMANEFRVAFDQMAREADLEEMRKELDAIKRDNALSAAKREMEAAVAPLRETLSPSGHGPIAAPDLIDDDRDQVCGDRDIGAPSPDKGQAA